VSAGYGDPAHDGANDVRSGTHVDDAIVARVVVHDELLDATRHAPRCTRAAPRGLTSCVVARRCTVAGVGQAPRVTYLA
jgi:inorganic pyrophosphatase/exopolyphosphatase